MRRSSLAFLVAMAALIAGPGSAGAATQVGETFDPTPGGPFTGNCSPTDRTYLQTSPAQYAAPFAGVITSWSFEAGDSPPGIKFKVARHEANGTFTIVGGANSLQSPLPNTLNTYVAQISVEAGDVLGLYIASTGQCGRAIDLSDPSYQFYAAIGDLSGRNLIFIGPWPGFQFDIAARLEPDADHDNYGDESQDQCPTDIFTHGPCKGPATAPLTCHGKPATIVGTSGPDVGKGTVRRDVIVGLGGNDKFSGVDGNDLICGGSGKDTLLGGIGDDKLYGEAGRDILQGGPGNDTLNGGAGKDKQVQ